MTQPQPSDGSKKSPRTFQCRDQLWETFEQMARELECSVDYLVNEAMKQYAKQRNYGVPNSGQQPGRTPFPGARESSQTDSRIAPPPPPPPPVSSSVVARPPQSSMASSSPRLPPPPVSSARGLPPPPPPPPSRGPAVAPPPLPPPGRVSHAATATPPPIQTRAQSLPPPIPAHGAPPPPLPAPVAVGALYALYQGERTSVNKEKFIIGRGRQTSDLTIKDPNVSRQHAMIEYQSGVYYMVDLGSTNGVEFNGQRVTRKAIGEGDVFRICDHEVVFTFR